MSGPLPRFPNCDPRDWFAARVLIEDRGYSSPCWIWRMAISSSGYAHTQVRFIDKIVAGAHCLSHLHFIGPIPPGYEVDHLCAVKTCVNPAHLEAVTKLENIRRSHPQMLAAGLLKRKEACNHGHPLRGDNIRIDYRGGRRCKECDRRRVREYRDKRRHAAREAA